MNRSILSMTLMKVVMLEARKDVMNQYITRTLFSTARLPQWGPNLVSGVSGARPLLEPTAHPGQSPPRLLAGPH